MAIMKTSNNPIPAIAIPIVLHGGKPLCRMQWNCFTDNLRYAGTNCFSGWLRNENRAGKMSSFVAASFKFACVSSRRAPSINSPYVLRVYFLHDSFLTRQLEKSYKTETTWDRGKSRRMRKRENIFLFIAGIELRVVVGFSRPRDREREGKSYIANFNTVSARTNGFVWKLPAAACLVKRIAFLRVTAHLELARVALAEHACCFHLLWGSRER